MSEIAGDDLAKDPVDRLALLRKAVEPKATPDPIRINQRIFPLFVTGSKMESRLGVARIRDSLIRRKLKPCYGLQWVSGSGWPAGHCASNKFAGRYCHSAAPAWHITPEQTASVKGWKSMLLQDKWRGRLDKGITLILS